MNGSQNGYFPSNNSKSLVVKKENVLLKIPWIRKIYETIQDKKRAKLTSNSIKNNILSGDDRISWEDLVKDSQANNTQYNNIQQFNVQQSNVQQPINTSNMYQQNVRQQPINTPNMYQQNVRQQQVYRPNVRQDLKQQNFKSQQPVVKETIVISDLHGDYNKWGAVKQQMARNPNQKFVILGDAMDKGLYGPEILLEIKELSDRGRVQYLPGNHDIFAYDYLMRKGTNDAIYQSALKHLEYNGGKDTIEKLENFDQVVTQQLARKNIHNPVTLRELTDWLGKQPIQEIIRENGHQYALSHAVFDTDLYNFDKEYNLEKALNMKMNRQNPEILSKFNNCMWYREQDPKTHFAPLSWPKDFLVVAGHTPQQSINYASVLNSPSKCIIYCDCGKGKFSGYNLRTQKIETIENNIPIVKRPEEKQF